MTETLRRFAKLEKDTADSRKARTRLGKNKAGFVLRDPATGKERITKKPPVTMDPLVGGVNRLLDMRKPAKKASPPQGGLQKGAAAVTTPGNVRVMGKTVKSGTPDPNGYDDSWTNDYD